MAQQPSHKVIVIIGTGGMGLPLARRLSSGRHLLLADNSPLTLQTALRTLVNEGHSATSHTLDITSYTSVQILAQKAASLGPLEAIINTAGVAPGSDTTTAQILAVDLLGTANIVQAFLPFVTAGTSLVCVASMAGSLVSLSPELEMHLATAPLESLLSHGEIEEGMDPGFAYRLAKRANVVRVQAAAKAWGKRGARVNCVSPGVISTGLVRSQLEGPSGDRMRSMVEGSAVGRIGTPEDVVNAVAFLVSSESSFVTGVDLLVDGGVVAGKKWE